MWNHPDKVPSEVTAMFLGTIIYRNKADEKGLYGASGNFFYQFIESTMKIDKKFNISVCFGTLLCLLFMGIGIFFTTDFVANNLSPDGILQQITIYKVNSIRIGFFLISTIGLLILSLFFIKPNSFYLLKAQISKIHFIIILLFFADLALCFAYLYFPNIGIKRFFDLGGELNIPTWYSSIKLFCVSLLAGLFTCRKFNRLDPRSYLLLLLPFIFFTLSIDETASIHEWLGFQTDFILLDSTREESFLAKTGTWMFIIGIPFFIIFLLYMFLIRKYFSFKSYVIILFGMVIFLTGALGIETLSNFFNDELMFIQVFCEELLEMVGVTIIFWGFYNLTAINWPSVLLAENERIII